MEPNKWYYAVLESDRGIEWEVKKFGIKHSSGTTSRNYNFSDSRSIQVTTRQPKDWGAGTNNYNYAYSEVIKQGWESPGTPPSTNRDAAPYLR